MNARQQAFEVAAPEGIPARRLDQMLAASLPAQERSLSRSRIKALIEGGQVRCDGRTVLDPAAKVAPGATVRVDLPPPEPSALEGEAIPLEIVFEDSDVLVLNKPAGLVVHPAPGHATGTLVQALIAHCGDSLSGVGGVKRPGIVHRLDKDTSGLMVVAKNDAAHQALAAQFADHGRTGPMSREYRAVVWGRLPAGSGAVDAPIGRHASNREKNAVRRDGKRAVTHWRRLADYGVASLVACRLETGRTHQIRVHMAHLGHPLLGDPVYGAGYRTKAAQLGPEERAALVALNRQALHAAELGFAHPRSGETLRFESPLPPDLARLVAMLEIGRPLSD